MTSAQWWQSGIGNNVINSISIINTTRFPVSYKTFEWYTIGHTDKLQVAQSVLSLLKSTRWCIVICPYFVTWASTLNWSGCAQLFHDRNHLCTKSCSNITPQKYKSTWQQIVCRSFVNGSTMQIKCHRWQRALVRINADIMDYWNCFQRYRLWGFRQWKANNACITPKPEPGGHCVTCKVANVQVIQEHYDDKS